jgi:PAS domain S-box-containing protein
MSSDARAHPSSKRSPILSTTYARTLSILLLILISDLLLLGYLTLVHQGWWIALLVTVSLFAIVAWAVTLIQRPVFGAFRTLLGLFNDVMRDPNATPVVPVDRYRPGSEVWQVMWNFRSMLQQIRESRQQLQESEERFHLAMRGTNDGLWDWDVRTNAIYFSPRWKEMLGYQDDELPNRLEEWSRRIHPDDIQRAMNTLNDHLAGKSRYYDLEHRLQHKDGSYRWIRTRGASLRDAADQAYRLTGSHTDITERKRVEEALRRRDAILEAVRFAAEHFLTRRTYWEESIQAVLAQLGQAARVSRVYIFENHLGNQGELLSSQRYEWTATGIPPQIDNPRFQNSTWTSPADQRSRELYVRGQVFQAHTRDLPEPERTLLRLEGVLSLIIVPIFVGGSWWGLIGFDDCLAERDWSAPETDALKAAASTLGAAIERERDEAAVRESEARFRMIAENSSVGFWQITPEGYTLYLNPAMRTMIELAVGNNLSGVWIYDFLTPESAEVVRREQLKREQGLASTYEAELIGRSNRRCRSVRNKIAASLNRRAIH